MIGLILAAAAGWQSLNQPTIDNLTQSPPTAIAVNDNSGEQLASQALSTLKIKGRASKTGYSRDKFDNGWAAWRNCDSRQRILARDLTAIKFDDDGCTVLTGILNDPYTGQVINFQRGAETSSLVQIDHVVALSDAWQKGAQDLTADERQQLANDDLELLAVDGSANQKKSGGDAATWLPSNKVFRCQYVARQIAVKIKYDLWLSQAEHDVMAQILATCPEERLPSP
jgi:hypothetical protein